MLVIPDAVKRKAVLSGASDWLDDLAVLVAALSEEWGLTPVRSFDGGTESLVLEVRLDNGTPAVLKLLIPRDDRAAANEITALRLADGKGTPKLFRHDRQRGALLMEQLGRSLFELSMPIARRQEIMCTAASKLWKPAPGCGLPTGAEKGQWLIEFIICTWEALDNPCSERAVDHAIRCAERRVAAHDDQRAVLVHGDVHQWNALESARGFKLVDPDGLLAEPEYDLGIIMREDPIQLLAGDPWDRAHRLASLSGLDPTAIWEWGAVERVSTGLLCTQMELLPVGRTMLRAAEVAAG